MPCGSALAAFDTLHLRRVTGHFQAPGNGRAQRKDDMMPALA
jgi:hypothetical protein